MWSAWWGGRAASGLAEVIDLRADCERLDDGGWWAVVIDFEYPQSGRARAWRFDDVRTAALPPTAGVPGLPGPSDPTGRWTTSLDRSGYTAGVREIRHRIREGEVYQSNLCRVLSVDATELLVRNDRASGGWVGDPYPFATRLAAGNPAPYAGVLHVPSLWLVSASPELFLRRDGELLTSGPIKGTATTADRLLAKDTAENIMITDLVRNDLHRVCRPGTVEVSSLLAVEQHPGLVHLVTTIRGRLRPGTGWRAVLAALCPPGSVSGAPKVTALQAISDLEPVSRGPYCGAVGFVDADRGYAELAVGIRTFWIDTDEEAPLLRFGTGAGITWGSDPDLEWEETELKAARLVGLAGGRR